MCLALQMITFQRKRANRRIENEADMLQLLRKYAPVQVVEFNASHSVREQIATIMPCSPEEWSVCAAWHARSEHESG